jgi:hypothetical protein
MTSGQLLGAVAASSGVLETRQPQSCSAAAPPCGVRTGVGARYQKKVPRVSHRGTTIAAMQLNSQKDPNSTPVFNNKVLGRGYG